MNRSLPHYASVSTLRYCRSLICLSLILLMTHAAKATCNAAWTYTIHGDTVFLQATDTTNLHYWSFNGVYSTTHSTTLTQVYPGPGTYHICQYVYGTAGTCHDSLCQNITIQAPCTISAAWQSTTSGDTVRFYAANTDTVAHHFWNFGDGTTASGSTATHIYANYGSYHVCFYDYYPGTVCSDSFCQNVNVTATTCHLNTAWTCTTSGDTVRVTALDSNTANHHYWSFGSYTTTPNNLTASYVFSQAGTYRVCLHEYTPGTTCVDSFCQNISVTAVPPCHITAAWTFTTRGDTVYFTAADTSSGTHHFWNFGDGSAIASGSYATHIYATAGSYHVCFYDYIPNTACIDSLCQNVGVTVSACHVSAAWTYTTHGDTVFLHSTDTLSANHHYWTFAGSTVVTSGTSVTHIYPNYGTYNICLHVYTPGTTCIDSSCNSVTIAAPCSLTSAWTYANHQNDTVRFYAADTSTIVHHYWTFGDGSAVTAGLDPIHVYAAAGTYTVCLHEYIPNTTCVDSFCGTISVGTPCHITAAWTETIHGDTVRFAGADSNTTAHHIWSYGDGTTGSGPSATHVYAQAGTYHVCYYVYIPGIACSDSFCNTITIGSGCHVSAAWSYTLHGDTVFLTSADTSSTNHHIWVFNGNTSNYVSGITATHVYTGPGTYHICLYVYTPGTTCTDSSCNNIIIANTCNVNAAWQSVTHGDTVRFYAGNTDTTVHRDWNFGDGTSGFGINPVHVYTQAGTYHVCMYAYTGSNCIDSFCSTVTVAGGCHVSAAWSYTLHGDTVYLSSVDTSSANHHYWIFNGNTSNYASGTSVTHIYTGPGTYHICLYVYTPGTTCTDSSCNNITIASNCIANAAWTSHDHGDTLFFAATDTASALNLDWNFGDGTYGFGQYPTHVYAQPGTYHVCLYAYTGTNCIDSFCNTITVNTGCHVSAAWTYTIHGDTVYLLSADTSAANHHNWTFGGTANYATGTSVTHIYTGPGTYHICLFVYTPGTNCIDSSCNNITIANTCNVNAAWQSYARGDTGHFYASGNTAGVSYSWNFGDGHSGTGSNPLHVYAQAGTYHVCLYAYTGTNCIDSFCNTITIGSGCAISSAWTYAAYGDSLHFAGSDSNTTAHHFWNFGDGTPVVSAYDASHVYAAPGTYNVCHYVYIPGTTCVDSSCNTVTVSGPCSVTAALQFINISHDTIAFYALFADSAANFTWIYGDGTTSSGAYSVHGYPVPGTYHVCLHVFIPGTPCSDSVCVDVNVGVTCAVTAAWTSLTRVNDSIQFYALDPDTSAHHIWTFGDGTTGSGSYAAHTYPTAGTYHVCLYVYVPGTTCSDSLCKDVSSVLGIGEVAGNYPSISLRPNPFSQYTILNIDGPASTYEVRIYDVIGQQVRTVIGVNNSIMIDRGNLSSGIYTYAVMAGGTVIGKGKMSIE